MALEDNQIGNSVWSSFEHLDIRVGTVLVAKEFEKAKKRAYQLQIDFGDLGLKWTSAQITDHYNIEQLVGMQLIAIVNMPKKQIANFFSECLVLGVVDSQNRVVLLKPDQAVSNGLRIK